MVLAPHDLSPSADSLRAKAAPIIEEATRRLVEEFQPEQVWLFGSYAWGEPTTDSDLDLLVIMPETDERPLKRAQRAHRCLRRLGMSKDVLVHTAREVAMYRNLVSSLTYKIFTSGRRVYG